MAGAVHATQFVQNGGFETLTSGAGQLGYNTNATGWTNGQYNANTVGYNFVFTTAAGTSGTNADTTGATGNSGNLKLYGPGNSTPTNNGLTLSPTGGNFIAADGAYQQAAITQTLTGLVVGSNYTVSFWWAAGQQTGYSGATTDTWTVGLNPVGQTSNKQTTGTINLPNHGFSGWQQQTFNYTATNTNEVLSFLATGTPNGEPPFALLDGVSVTGAIVPEPSTVAAMFAGVLGLGLIVLRRNRTKKAL